MDKVVVIVGITSLDGLAVGVVDAVVRGRITSGINVAFAVVGKVEIDIMVGS